MNTHEWKIPLLVCISAGFLLGILYANFVAKQYMMEIGIFSDYFLNQYRQTEFIAQEYAWYVARARLVPLVVILGLGITKIRRAAVCGALTWTGFLAGVLVTASIVKMGMRGILLCLAGFFPHFIFYTLAYAVLLLFLYAYPQNKWSVWKTVFVVLSFAMGLITEVTVNPVIVKACIRLLK